MLINTLFQWLINLTKNQCLSLNVSSFGFPLLLVACASFYLVEELHFVHGVGLCVGQGFGVELSRHSTIVNWLEKINKFLKPVFLGTKTIIVTFYNGTREERIDIFKGFLYESLQNPGSFVGHPF